MLRQALMCISLSFFITQAGLSQHLPSQDSNPSTQQQDQFDNELEIDSNDDRPYNEVVQAQFVIGEESQCLVDKEVMQILEQSAVDGEHVKPTIAETFETLSKLYDVKSSQIQDYLYQAAQYARYTRRKIQQKTLKNVKDTAVGRLSDQIKCLRDQKYLSEEQSNLLNNFILKKNVVPTGIGQSVQESIMDTFRNLYQGKFDVLDSQLERLNFDMSSPKFHEQVDMILAEIDKDRFTQSTTGNWLKLLVDGEEFKSSLISIVRQAKRFINVTYFELYNDRFGKEFTLELVARKLRLPPETVQEILKQKGWDLFKHGKQIREWFVSSYLRTHAAQELQQIAVSLNPKYNSLTEEKRSKFLKDKAEDIYKRYAANSIEIRFLLDFLNVGTPLGNLFRHVLKSAELSRTAVVPVMRKFGIEIVYLPSFFFFNDHAKVTSSESEAVLSGGNIVDKVMAMEKPLIWHDLAVHVRGPLVNKTNGFFFKFFNSSISINKIGRFIDVRQIGGLYGGRVPQQVDLTQKSHYFPKQPINSKTTTVYSRLATTSPGKGILSPDVGPVLLWAAVAGAKNYIYLENSFFSSPFVAKLLISKAKEMNLKGIKIQNQEMTAESAPEDITANCDITKIKARKMTSAEGNLVDAKKAIVVILPKKMDQGGIAVINKAMLNDLLKEGVDVCYWDSEIANENLSATIYEKNVMMHSKAWLVENHLPSGEVQRTSYVGSQNLTWRSEWSDLEVGVISTEDEFSQDLHDRVMIRDLAASKPARGEHVTKNFLKKIFGFFINIFF